MPEHQLETVARAICQACDENPDHAGDCRGNEFRWQDYTPAAEAALQAMQIPLDDREPVTDYQRRILSTVPQLPQRQDSVNSQLNDLRPVANRLGMYDAADMIRTLVNQ